MAPTTTTSFGGAGNNTSVGRMFGGKTARDIVYAFYQKYNPTKVADVDKVLQKYTGKEEQLLRNLAKKYNVDPTLLGLPPQRGGTLTAAPGGFGQVSGLGGGSSGFASHASSSTPSTFGSFASSNQTSSGFGGLSGAGPQSTFNGAGAASNTGFSSFGSNPSSGFGSSPFGAARR